jgi:hypothetical protein
MKINFKKVTMYLLSAVVLSTPLAVNGAQLGQMDAQFADNFTLVYNFAIGIATLIFVILFLVGGIMYLTAAGNDESTKKARSLIVDAVIGLIIVLIAWSAGSWIIKQLAPANSFVTDGAIQQ